MKEIWFHDMYKPGRDEVLRHVLSGHRFGWNGSNPGPIVAYPVNRPLFPLGVPDTISAGTGIAIPWTQHRLKTEIALTQDLIEGRKQTLTRSVQALRKGEADVSKVAVTVDVIAAVLTLKLGTAKLAMQTQKVLAATTAKKAAELATKVGVSGTRAISGVAMYTGVKTIVGLDPSAFVGRGRSWWQVASRHALGITSPSYWASLAASAWTGDWDFWKYGSTAVRDREIAARLRIFTKEVAGFTLKIAALDQQYHMPFYRYRIHHSSAIYRPPASCR